MTGVHGQVLGHVVRRSVEALSDQKNHENMHRFFARYELPSWAVGGIAVYAVVFAILLASIRYTIGDVIATLMMVETPSTTETLTISTSDNKTPLEKEPLLDTEALTVTASSTQNQAVTRNARHTMRHLVRRAGPFARWRALPLYFAHHAAAGLVTLALSPRRAAHTGGLPMLLVHAAVAILATVLTSPLHAAWTHGLIAAPEGKQSAWSRVRGMFARGGVMKSLMLPSVVYAGAQQLTIGMPVVLACVLGVHKVRHGDLAQEFSSAEKTVFALKLVACAATMAFVAVAVLLPAAVTLTRMEASLLPEEEDAMVPFDRTFGTRVSELGCVGFVDAWRTVDRVVRLRIVKVYAQLFTMQMVIIILGMMGLASFVAGFKHVQATPN
ncbi:MAG: hypothetical protein M1821_009940 [Bathelium mastoideum]|nr:MAG: hypothetical protein M1821_009940 [Bathelium mastoideum]